MASSIMSTPRKASKKHLKKTAATPLSSQSVSSALSQSKSSDSELRSKLAKASELESRLVTLLATKNSETQASKLRIELCAIFSEILVADATFSARKDVCGRMWRACFYGRIVELRNRISKEKQRRKKQASNESAKNKVEEVEGFLNAFIKDAVVLYQYLLRRYHECILESQGISISQTQQSQESQATKSPLSSGVIPTLHKLYIHLGDLHRYSADFNAAETAYLNAALLAPGKGNPYNQLAVVAQLKDASSMSNGKLANSLAAVSLYWYCRSLLAVNDPFFTAKANMERLFISNRNWITSQAADKSAAFVHGVNIDIDTTSYCTAGLSREKIRSVKAAASRMFLSRFVDLHWDILNPSAHVDLTKMKKIMKMFNSLLEESSFSDGLLIKMACINAFSVWNLHESKDVSENKLIVALANLISFGTTLAKHLKGSITKLDSKLGAKASPSLIRLFGPFLIYIDFVSDLWLSKRNIASHIFAIADTLGKEESELLTDFHKNFWSEVAMLANILNDSKAILSILGGSSLFDAYEETNNSAVPKEYKFVRGYTPFISFAYGESCDQSAECDSSTNEEEKSGIVTSKLSVYVSAEDVVQGLDLLSLSQGVSLSQTSKLSQSSNNSKNSTGNPQSFTEDTKAKLFRFTSILRRHSNLEVLYESNEIPNFVSIQNQNNTWNVRSLLEDSNDDQSQTQPMVVDINSSLNPSSLLDDLLDKTKASLIANKLSGVPVDVDDDDEEDVVVYKASESGNGPALLVPGALLLGNKTGTSNQNSVVSDNIHSNLGNDLNNKQAEKSPNLLEQDTKFNDSSDNPLNLSLLLEKSSNKTNTLFSSTPPRPVNESCENSSCEQMPEINNSRAYELPQSMPPKKPLLQPPPGFSSSSFESHSAAKDGVIRPFPINDTNQHESINLMLPAKVAPMYQSFGQDISNTNAMNTNSPALHARIPPGFNQVPGPGSEYQTNHNVSHNFPSQGLGHQSTVNNDIGALPSMHVPYQHFNLHTSNPFATSVPMGTNNNDKSHFEPNECSEKSGFMHAYQGGLNRNQPFESNGLMMSNTQYSNQKSAFDENVFDFGSNLNNKDLLGTVDLFGLKSLGIFSSGDNFFEDAHADTKNDTDLQSELHLKTQNPFVAP